MSSKEFWNDNPDLFWAYRFSYYNREKNKQQQMNYNAWLQGAYIYEAVSVALNNAFNKQKASYAKLPYGIELESKTNEKKANDVVIKLKDRISQVQAIFNKNKQSSTAEEGDKTERR